MKTKPLPVDFAQKLLARLEGEGKQRLKHGPASPLDDHDVLLAAAQEYINGEGLLTLAGKYNTHNSTLRKRFRALLGLPKSTQAERDLKRQERKAQKLSRAQAKAAKFRGTELEKIASFIKP